ncbi:ribonuclease III [Parvicella tangerina]|uniref:Ribonuclease 3 n=1 Tax=Parvicella tangerina TaxID=2829795 RepID=A0A916NTG2_9FLAO|nr:ribonuclease III [Parvicella tangerina]CAG5085825.1 Ribonuclease 3 [Parvicella tangerina]
MGSIFFWNLKKSDREKQINYLIQTNFGLKPKKFKLYEQALTHKSYLKKNADQEHNERLEFLGDAVISTVVAEVLFYKYPTKTEGQLTQMRARIVSRDNLNVIGDKIGLEPFINYQKTRNKFKSLMGNTVESIVGALFVEFGYDRTATALKKNIFNEQFNFEEVVKQNVDYKSQLIIQCQRNRQEIKFELIEEVISPNGKPVFTMAVVIDEEEKARADAFSKRKAEQKAAKKVLDTSN